MKKIFTLIVALGLITFVQAQRSPGKDGRYDDRNSPSQSERNYPEGYENGGNSRNNNIISWERQRNMEISRINREYDSRIARVRDNFFKSRSQKKSQIRLLEAQRQHEIRMVYNKFSREQARADRSKRRY